MKSYKLRLRFNKDQEKLAWNYSRVARNYWNLLVDIDNRNNKGEFDELLKDKNLTTYKSEFHNRDIYSLNQSDYSYLAKTIVEQDREKYFWYFQKNLSFIFSSVERELIKIRFQNRGRLSFRSVEKHTPSFNVRCDTKKPRLSRIYLKSSNQITNPNISRS